MQILACILLFIFLNIDAQNTIELKVHEQWWENNIDQRMHNFKHWLGDINADSRIALRNHIKKQHYQSILDVPSGLCIDYEGLKTEQININYQGLDITPKLVDRAQKLGIKVQQGSIENIPWSNSFFDLVYARHILEHLDYYTSAITELIRVAKKEVFIVFFRKPHHLEDSIIPAKINGEIVYHNTYSKRKLEDYILSNKKVASIEWENINKQEIILHIYMQ